MWNYAPTEHPGFGLSPGPHHDFTTGVKLGQACQALREAFFLTFIQDVRSVPLSVVLLLAFDALKLTHPLSARSMRGIAVSYEDEVEGFSMWTETRFVSVRRRVPSSPPCSPSDKLTRHPTRTQGLDLIYNDWMTIG